MEECAAYFNKSDPLRDAILFNEEEQTAHPCLIQGELKVRTSNVVCSDNSMVLKCHVIGF